MRRKFLSLILLLLVSWSVAFAQQPYVSTAEDIALGGILLQELAADAPRKSASEQLVQAALAMLGQPYVAWTQEGREEKLRIYLTKTDCILFVDNALGLVLTARRLGTQATFEDLAETLEPSRHNADRVREGYLPYATRVHYVTEWIARDEALGYFRDITEELGGIPDTRKIDFMSTHPDSYAELAGDSPSARRNLEDIVRMEEAVNRIPHRYIPKDRVAAVQDQIRSGDILCFATSIDGLDYSHVAVAYRPRPGAPLSFIHASSAAMKVIVEPGTLVDYLAKHSKSSGISVLRLED